MGWLELGGEMGCLELGGEIRWLGMGWLEHITPPISHVHAARQLFQSQCQLISKGIRL